MRVVLYGASDDLIEVEGDISDEWGVYLHGADVVHVAVSCGTLLRFTYDDDGLWRIAVLDKGNADVQHEPGSVPDDTCDRVTITAPELRWVVLSKPAEVTNSNVPVLWAKANATGRKTANQ